MTHSLLLLSTARCFLPCSVRPASPPSRPFSQGKGIFLVNKISQLMQWKKGTQRRQEDDVELYVVQRYIERPLLVGGRKFDLRLYCLVTSFRPLTAYLHRAGFARCSSDTYKLSAGTLGDVEKASLASAPQRASGTSPPPRMSLEMRKTMQGPACRGAGTGRSGCCAHHCLAHPAPVRALPRST